MSTALSALKSANEALKVKFTDIDRRLDTLEATLGVRNASNNCLSFRAINNQE